jgi:hypothetical protein
MYPTPRADAVKAYALERLCELNIRECKALIVIEQREQNVKP